jgi:hypothetical protein
MAIMSNRPSEDEPLGEAVLVSLERLSQLIAASATMTHEWDVFNLMRDIAGEAYTCQLACREAHKARAINNRPTSKGIDLDELDI